MNVNYEYIYNQTVAGPDSFNHWADLIVDVLQSSNRTKAKLLLGQWAWEFEAVRKAMAVPPRELEKVLARRAAQ